MSKNDTGCLYLKLTSNGNLIGEFSSYGFVSTESALRVGRKKGQLNTFIGNYKSSWLEDTNAPFVDLTISKKSKKSSEETFALEWRKSGTTIYVGEAMLCDGMLVGYFKAA